jgi:hypothetical protein
MTTETISHWQLQIAEPQRGFKSTKKIHILAPEMIDAIVRVHELYPTSRIFNCIHRGTFEGELYVRPKTPPWRPTEGTFADDEGL